MARTSGLDVPPQSSSHASACHGASQDISADPSAGSDQSSSSSPAAAPAPDQSVAASVNPAVDASNVSLSPRLRGAGGTLWFPTLTVFVVLGFVSILRSLLREEVDLFVQEELLSHVSARLSSEQASLCEGYLSMEEVFTALIGMAKGKAPGSDGFQMEFYVAFWDILGRDLVEVLNASLDRELCLSPREVLSFPSFSKRGIDFYIRIGGRLAYLMWTTNCVLVPWLVVSRSSIMLSIVIRLVVLRGGISVRM